MALQEAIKRLRFVYTHEGAEQTAAAHNKVADAQARVVTTATASERAQLSLDRQFSGMERRLNPVVRAQQEYERTVRLVNAAVAQNPALQARANAVLEQARQRLLDVTGAVDKHEAALGRMANTLTRRVVFAFLIREAKELASVLLNLNAEIAKTADIAARTGVGGGLFQGLSTAAGFKGIGAGQFADDMLKFNQQVDEARVGLGSLGTLLRANRLTVSDTADAFLKVADLVKNARSEADKFSILQQAGLPASREFVRLMEQGGEAIAKQAAEAEKLTDQQLQSAQRVEDRWNEMWTNFTRAGKRAVVEVYESLPDRLRLIGSIITRGGIAPPNGMATRLRAGEQLTSSGADAFYRAVGFGVGDRETVNPQRQKELIDLEQRRISILGELVPVSEQVAAAMRKINQEVTEGVNISPRELKALEERTRLLAEAARLENQLGFERAQLTRSPTEARVAETLRGQGISADSSRGQAVSQMIRFNEQLKLSIDLSTEFATGFVRDLRNGVSALQALTNALNRFVDRLLDMAVSNLVKSAFGGLLGSFGGGISTGTVAASGAGIVGVAPFATAHAGGIVGDSLPTRYAHPSVFAGAPRMHGGGVAGLRPDEVPTILQRGERVIPRGGAGGTTININSTYQIEGAVSQPELAAAIARSHRQAVQEAVSITAASAPARQERYAKLGT